MIRTFLLSSLPPPDGGVNIWTRWFMQCATSYGIEVDFSRIGAVALSDQLRPHMRAMRLGRGLIRPLWHLLGGRARHNDVMHICVSGGPSFWRGLALVAVRARQGQACVLHLHSRLSACDASSIQLARRLARLPLVAWVTPCRLDSVRIPELTCVDHFVPPDFGVGHRWRGATGDGPLRFVNLGTMVWEKGIFNLIDLVRNVPRATVDVYGPDVRPGQVQAWRKRVQEAGVSDRLRYRGSLPHRRVAATLCNSDGLLFCSRDESFGLVAAEAMHLGVPVISTRVGYLAHASAESFVSLGPAAAHDFAAVCAPPSRLRAVAAAGSRYFRESFGRDGVMRTWHALYAQLLARSGQFDTSTRVA